MAGNAERERESYRRGKNFRLGQRELREGRKEEEKERSNGQEGRWTKARPERMQDGLILQKTLRRERFDAPYRIELYCTL